MRLLTLTLSLFLLIPSTTFGQCSRETDEFTGETTVTCENTEVPVEEQPQHALFGAWATVVRGDDGIGIVITVGSDTWNFLDVDKAHAIINGRRHEFLAADGERSVESGTVIEQKVIPLTSGTAKDVAAASTFRVKLGSAALDLSPITDHVRTIIEMK